MLGHAAEHGRTREVTAKLLFVAAVLLAGCASPDYGKDGLPGRAHDKQLSKYTYAIRAYSGAYSPPAMLKPLVVARARAVGKAHGFKSFAIETADVEYDGRGNGYGAATVVKYSSAMLPTVPGITYVVDTTDRYHPDPKSVETSRLAKIRGSRTKAVGGLSLVPVFLDAVTGTGNASATATAFLKPGPHRFYVHYWLNRSLLANPDIGFTVMQHVLEAGKSYVVMGRYNDDVLEVWLQDEALQKPVGRPQLIPAMR